MNDYAVVFSGGGALGAWEVGCYRAILEKHNNAPSIVTGASAGALNAAAICAGFSTDQLTGIWKQLEPKDVYVSNQRVKINKLKIISSFLFGKEPVLEQLKRLASERGTDSIYNTEPLKKTLRKIFTENSVNTFLGSEMKCVISSTDLTQSRRVFHYHQTPSEELPSDLLSAKEVEWRKIGGHDTLIPALIGTSALPILFPPSDEFLFDGGVLHNQPITPALSFGALRIYVLIPATVQPGSVSDLLNIGNTLLTVWLTNSLLAQVDSVRMKNEIRDTLEQPKVCLCIIRPAKNLTEEYGATLLSFGHKVNELVEDGYRSANSRLAPARFDPNNEQTWY